MRTPNVGYMCVWAYCLHSFVKSFFFFHFASIPICANVRFLMVYDTKRRGPAKRADASARLGCVFLCSRNAHVLIYMCDVVDGVWVWVPEHCVCICDEMVSQIIAGDGFYWNLIYVFIYVRPRTTWCDYANRFAHRATVPAASYGGRTDACLCGAPRLRHNNQCGDRASCRPLKRGAIACAYRVSAFVDVVCSIKEWSRGIHLNAPWTLNRYTYRREIKTCASEWPVYFSIAIFIAEPFGCWRASP